MKKLKAHKTDWGQIERFLNSADKKLTSARKVLAFDEEACLQLAYEAMLKGRWASCSAMVFEHGANRGITSPLLSSCGAASTRSMRGW